MFCENHLLLAEGKNLFLTVSWLLRRHFSSRTRHLVHGLLAASASKILAAGAWGACDGTATEMVKNDEALTFPNEPLLLTRNMPAYKQEHDNPKKLPYCSARVGHFGT